MACVTTQKCCFKGRGKVYLQAYDTCCGTDTAGTLAYPLIEFGNASDLTLDVTTTDETASDYTTAAGGTFCSVSTIDTITLTMTGKCMNPLNFARQYSGQVNEVTANTTVAFVGKVRAKGQFIPFVDAAGNPLTNVDVSSVSLTVAGGLLPADYTINENGILISPTSTNPIFNSIPVTGIAIIGELDHGEIDRVELLTDITQEVGLFFDGVNAITGEKFAGWIYRMKPKAGGGVNLLSEGIADFAFEAEVLADSCKTGTGSKYGTFAFTA